MIRKLYVFKNEIESDSVRLDGVMFSHFGDVNTLSICKSLRIPDQKRNVNALIMQSRMLRIKTGTQFSSGFIIESAH